MRLLIAAAVAAVAVAAAPASQAHNVGWSIHKAWCNVSGTCKDKPPKHLSPQGRCHSKDDVGKTEDVWDPYLEKYVRWICIKTENGYGWRRSTVTHDPNENFWLSQPTRAIFEYHRACKSIVCLPELVWHANANAYPTRKLNLTPAQVAAELAAAAVADDDDG
jgi:hypothetical protein